MVRRGTPGGAALPIVKARYACGVAAISTDCSDCDEFVASIASEADEISAGFVLIYFSQSLIDPSDLAKALRTQVPALAHAGCSTAGEVTPRGLEEGHALAILFPANAFRVVSAMVPDISHGGFETTTRKAEELRRLIQSGAGGASATLGRDNFFALCLIDGLSYAEEAVSSAIHWGLDDIPLIGGSAGDDLKFQATTLIHNGVVASDCAIIALFATDLPFHVFKSDNFVATGNKLIVTASDPDRRIVRELNAATAATEYAAAVGVMSGALTPLSFASHPVVVRVSGEYFCRSIQKVHDDGSLSFFCAIDDGIVLSTAEAKELVESTRAALDEVETVLGGIDMILGFDCVLRRLDAQNRQVLREMSELYRTRNVVGFGTYGEQYRSMHLNQTFTGVAFGRREGHAA